MADIVIGSVQANQYTYSRRLRDMGDGTHAEVVAVGPQDDGDNPAIGATTDAAASSTVAENATARTGIGLWKGIKNILILLTTAMGEVQATPTANTLLARLKALLTGIVLAAGTNTIGATTDAGPGFTGLVRKFVQNDDISTARELIAASVGMKMVLVDCWVTVDTACYVTIQDSDSAVIAGGYCGANSGLPLTLRGMLKSPTANKAIQMKSSVAAKGACILNYYPEA